MGTLVVRGANELVQASPFGNRSSVLKKRLDNFWQSQDIVYDFKARIRGAGSRSML